MTRFAGQAFNNIRRTDVQPELYDISKVTTDELPKFIAQKRYIAQVLRQADDRERAAFAAAERDKQRFGFNPRFDPNEERLAQDLTNYERWVRNTSVPLDQPFGVTGYGHSPNTGAYLNLASDKFNQNVFDAQGAIEANKHAVVQKELARMLKLERYHRLAADNEAQSFNNMMERGLINAPVAENRIAGKRQEQRRMNNIRTLREDLQDADEMEARRMQKAADKYFGRTKPPARKGPPYGTSRWDDAPLVPDYPDVPF